MKTTVFAILCISIFAFGSCKKDNNTNNDTSTLEGQVLVDFSNQLVNPNYQDIQAKAGILKDAADALIANTTDQNLAVTRTSWKNTRAAWESCEGFLFGPVEDFSYDPTMDDWPVNSIDLDSLITTTANPLALADVDALPTTLKGFHAIEYIIFGVGGNKKAAEITGREKTYLASLTASLYNTTTELRNSWDPSQPDNYTVQVINAGKGSAIYNSRQAVFLALVTSMADICNEVADEKMMKPLVKQDSTQCESQFSHNSTIDFTNNIKGVLNAYLSKYNNTGGHSLSELVASKNTSLNSKLLSQMNAAIASFGTITATYEKAIYSQKNQIKGVQASINTLKETIDTELGDFVKINIKD